MSERKRPPLYQRRPSGGRRGLALAGVEARRAPGTPADAAEVVWLVRAVTLADGVVPAPGDRMRDTSGQWWTAAEVGAASADGEYPVRCTRHTTEGE